MLWLVTLVSSAITLGNHGRGLCHLRLRQRSWLASAVGGEASASAVASFAGGERSATLALCAVRTEPSRGALWCIALGWDTEDGSVTMRAVLGSSASAAWRSPWLHFSSGAVATPTKLCGPPSTTTVGAFVAFAFGIALSMLRPSVVGISKHIEYHHCWGLCRLRLRHSLEHASAFGGGR